MKLFLKGTQPVFLPYDPVEPMEAVTKQYADRLQSDHAMQSGLHLGVGQRAWLDAVAVSSEQINQLLGVRASVQQQLDDKLALSGGRMEGPLLLHTPPTDAEHAVGKGYVDIALLEHASSEEHHLGANQRLWLDSVQASASEVNTLQGILAPVQQQLDGKLSNLGGLLEGSLTLVQGAAVKVSTPPEAADELTNKAYVDAKFEGRRWRDPITCSALLGTQLSSPPAVCEEGDSYIVASPASGEWVNWEGHVVTFSAGVWKPLQQRAVAQGDRFGVNLDQRTQPQSDLMAYNGSIITLLSVQDGVYIWQEDPLTAGTSVIVFDKDAVHFGYTYSLSDEGVWVITNTSVNLAAGAGIGMDNNVLSVRAGVGLEVLDEELSLSVDASSALRFTPEGRLTLSLHTPHLQYLHGALRLSDAVSEQINTAVTPSQLEQRSQELRTELTYTGSESIVAGPQKDWQVRVASPQRLSIGPAGLDLSETGVSAGSYRQVQVDVWGRVVQGDNPTTLAGYGITDAQPHSARLDAFVTHADTGLLALSETGNVVSRGLKVLGGGLSLTHNTGAGGDPTIISNASSQTAGGTLVLRDESGDFSARIITAQLNGNANSTNVLSTPRAINGVPFDGAQDITLSQLYDETGQRMTHPKGGVFTHSNPTQTGAITIELPVGMNSSMVRFTLKVFDYTDNGSFEVSVGGLNHSGGTWMHPFAYAIGHPDKPRTITARFGRTAAGKAAVYLGETGDVWNYTQLFITDVQVGYASDDPLWKQPWSVSISPSAPQNVSATVAVIQVGYSSVGSAPHALVRRDANGNICAYDASVLFSSTDTGLRLRKEGDGVALGGASPRTLTVGGLCVSDQWSDRALTPENGIYSKGSLRLGSTGTQPPMYVSSSARVDNLHAHRATVADQVLWTNVQGRPELVDSLQASLDAKVDKVPGKQLSSYDFTAEDRIKLDGIAVEANKYVPPNTGVVAGTYPKVTVNEQGAVLAGEGLVASDIPGVLAGVIDRAHLLTISDVNLGANPATLVNHAQPGVSIHTVSKSYIESGASASDYCDLMYFNSHNNASRGNNNALLFTKTGARGIYHYSTVWDGVAWGTPKQLAYTDSDITGNAATASTLQTARSFAFTGDAVSPAQNFNGSSNLSFALTLASTGVTAGTYRSVTVDTKGRVTSGTNPTTLAGYGITDAATITQLNTQIQALQSQIDELRSYLMMKI